MGDVVFYEYIAITDKTMFLDKVEMPNQISITKEYAGDMCTVTFHNIEERLVKDVKRRLATRKAWYYSGRTVVNTGAFASKFTKALSKGSKSFITEFRKETEKVNTKLDDNLQN